MTSILVIGARPQLRNQLVKEPWDMHDVMSLPKTVQLFDMNETNIFEFIVHFNWKCQKMPFEFMSPIR